MQLVVAHPPLRPAARELDVVEGEVFGSAAVAAPVAVAGVDAAAVRADGEAAFGTA